MSEEAGESVVFRANLADRQTALLMSGRGDRLLIEFEAFGLDAVMALIGLTKFTGKSFKVTVEALNPDNWTELDNEITSSAKRTVITVGRGGSSNRRNKQAGGAV